MEKNKTREDIIIRAQRNQDIQAASKAYPGVEMGHALNRWLSDQGRPAAAKLTTEHKERSAATLAAAKALMLRPCSAAGCTGSQILESICTSCIEGQAGYKTKWTCKLCMHRDLSKDDLNTWLKRLSSL